MMMLPFFLRWTRIFSVWTRLIRLLAATIVVTIFVVETVTPSSLTLSHLVIMHRRNHHQPFTFDGGEGVHIGSVTGPPFSPDGLVDLIGQAFIKQKSLRHAAGGSGCHNTISIASYVKPILGLMAADHTSHPLSKKSCGSGGGSLSKTQRSFSHL
jgi:hypothetical protein